MKKIFVLLVSIFMVIFCVSCAINSTPSLSLKKASLINQELGLGYLKEGEYQRAEEKLLLAKKQDSHAAGPLLSLAYFYQKTGSSKLAESLYKKTLLLDPTNYEALNNYGVFLCREKEYKRAKQQFKLAEQNAVGLERQEANENAKLCKK